VTLIIILYQFFFLQPKSHSNINGKQTFL